MQATAAIPFFSSLPHPPAADHDIKRRYLALLPPQQIIEICLTLEFHVPLYVKSSVWPADINAAIATIEGRPSSNGTPEGDPKNDDLPLMDSLEYPTEADEPPEKEYQEHEDNSEDDSPSAEESKTHERHPSPTPVPESKTATSVTTTTMATSAVVSQSPKPAATVVPTPIVRPAAYPHQPYGYHAYPHASYYPQHAWPYPHIPYPPPPPAQVPSAYHQPPVTPAYSQTSYQNTPPPPSSEPTQTVLEDNLPSYEDMIVEALVDANDSDGIAPKDVYAWMAAHYPVQANFRPSASQALQKAYRRGRFKKSSSGKYRLNPEYKGNNTISRRPTRRPQTVNSAPTSNSSSQPRSSPFTHAPLIKNGTKGATASQRTPYSAGYSAPFTPSVVNRAAVASTVDTSTGDIGDAYAAAQHILKTINFGESLLGLSKKFQDTAAPVTSVAAPAGEAITMNDEDDDDMEWEAGIRAHLQAQLALLAAQLAEYAQESHHGNSGVDTGQQLPPSSDTAMPVDDEDDDEDMDEVIIP
ncbi:uncharacterized protein BT62DRAFT_563947 [Guyanagaster necrorhizus]|uniref:Histone H1 n=1 Tax=Guyanagaster necrorhizus TaxID=856835 RepID=A0A9P7VIV7_9AGAR|nr:uncharacterized protein BT62DRAFT_563947 [Guyanagaster necrorhizus MCA 3950]KAG7440846.1 hypothetical protein BT62DRAFT_563947 [Guyanagaster necrorhizus MCA 3950]